MSFKRFSKSSGVVLIVAGFTIGIATLLHPAVDNYSDVVHTARWNIVHGVVALGLLFSLFGLVGIYFKIADENDLYGMIGLLFALIGTAINSGMYLIHEGVFLPALDLFGNIDALLASDGEIAQSTLFNFIGSSTFIFSAIGFVLLGIKIFRSSSLPKYAGILLLLGGPLFSGPAPTPGAVLLGIGFVWLGVSLLSD